MKSSLAGKKLHYGQFEIKELIGQGGMGAVYAGIELHSNLPVAIKVLLSPQQKQQEVDGQFVQEDSLRRLRDEASAAAAVNNENLVKIITTGDDDELGPYIIYEFLPNGSLRDHLKVGRSFSTQEAIENIALPALSALAALHCKNICHRDIKPENLFCAANGKYKVGDLGLALFTGRQSATATGVIVGTPLYLPPERILEADEKGTPAGDCYALALLLVEAMTGSLPFPDLKSSIVHSQLNSGISSNHLTKHGVPRHIAKILATALDRKIEDRYGSAKEFAQQLKRALRQLKIPVKATALVGSAVVTTSAEKMSESKKWKRVPTTSSLLLAMSAGLILLCLFDFWPSPRTGTGITKDEVQNSLPSKIEKEATYLFDRFNQISRGYSSYSGKELCTTLNGYQKFVHACQEFEKKGKGRGSVRKHLVEKELERLRAAIKKDELLSSYTLALIHSAKGKTDKTRTHLHAAILSLPKAFEKPTIEASINKLALMAHILVSYPSLLPDSTVKAFDFTEQLGRNLIDGKLPYEVSNSPWGKVCSIGLLLLRTHALVKMKDEAFLFAALRSIEVMCSAPDLPHSGREILHTGLKKLCRLANLGEPLLSKAMGQNEFKEMTRKHLSRADKEFYTFFLLRNKTHELLKNSWSAFEIRDKSEARKVVHDFVAAGRKVLWQWEVLTTTQGASTTLNGRYLQTLLDTLDCQVGTRVYFHYFVGAWKTPWLTAQRVHERFALEYLRYVRKRDLESDMATIFYDESSFIGIACRYMDDWQAYPLATRKRWVNCVEQLTREKCGQSKSGTFASILARCHYEAGRLSQAATLSNKSIRLLLESNPVNTKSFAVFSNYWELADSVYNNHFHILARQKKNEEIMKMGKSMISSFDVGLEKLKVKRERGDSIRMTLILTCYLSVPKSKLRSLYIAPHRNYLERAKKSFPRQLSKINSLLN